MSEAELEQRKDPYSDPRVLGAVALTRFSWGEVGRENQDLYLALMSKSYGMDEHQAREVQARLNSTRSLNIEN